MRRGEAWCMCFFNAPEHPRPSPSPSSAPPFSIRRAGRGYHMRPRDAFPSPPLSCRPFLGDPGGQALSALAMMRRQPFRRRPQSRRRSSGCTFYTSVLIVFFCCHSPAIPSYFSPFSPPPAGHRRMPFGQLSLKLPDRKSVV